MSAPVDPRTQFGQHGEWDELAVGWALSALDPEDEGRFAEHLPGCARCTATVRESLYTVADLAYVLPDEAPPPALKSRLMAAVAAGPRIPGGGVEPAVVPAVEPERNWPLGEPHPGSPGYGNDRFALPTRSADTPARPTGPQDRTPAAGGGELGRLEPSGYRGGDLEDLSQRGRGPVPVGPEDTVGPRGSGRRRWVLPVVAGAAAAVLALIAALLVSNARLRDQRDDLRQIVARREAAIRGFTANEPARVAALTADGQPSPERRATLVVRGDQIEIIVETLGPTTGAETYWLWTLRCDTPQPTDLKPIRWFTVTQSEFSIRNIGFDPGVASAPCFAISSELGSATPKAPRHVVAMGQPS